MDPEKAYILAGDIGGTKSTMALVEAEGKDVAFLHFGRFESGRYSSIEEIIGEFLLQVDIDTARTTASFGIAGPVKDGGRPWSATPIPVTLPSRGRFQPEDNVLLDPSGRVEVYPMTARDEVLLHDPPSLVSGTAVRDIVARCVPGVKDPNVLPVVDVRVLLLAVRCASYGDEWDMEISCPRCSSRQAYRFHIPTALASVETLEDEYVIEMDRPKARFVLRPFPWYVSHQSTLVAAEETRIVRTVVRSELSEEEKRRKIMESIARLHDETIRTVAVGGIVEMEIEGRKMTDHGEIEEALASAPPRVWRTVRAKVDEINAVGLPSSVPATCVQEGCGHTFSVDVVYDPVRFFSVS